MSETREGNENIARLATEPVADEHEHAGTPDAEAPGVGDGATLHDHVSRARARLAAVAYHGAAAHPCAVRADDYFTRHFALTYGFADPVAPAGDLRATRHVPVAGRVAATPQKNESQQARAHAAKMAHSLATGKAARLISALVLGALLLARSAQAQTPADLSDLACLNYPPVSDRCFEHALVEGVVLGPLGNPSSTTRWKWTLWSRANWWSNQGTASYHEQNAWQFRVQLVDQFGALQPGWDISCKFEEFGTGSHPLYAQGTGRVDEYGWSTSGWAWGCTPIGGMTAYVQLHSWTGSLVCPSAWQAVNNNLLGVPVWDSRRFTNTTTWNFSATIWVWAGYWIPYISTTAGDNSNASFAQLLWKFPSYKIPGAASCVQ